MAEADATRAASPPIVRVFADEESARVAIRALRTAGVQPEWISVLTRSPQQAEELEHDEGASEDLEHVALHHHPFSEFVDWLGRVESVVVPGFGAVLSSGNLWQDVAIRAEHGPGSVTGALVGLGLLVEDAANLEQQVLEGRIVMVVHGAYDTAVVRHLLG